MLGLRSWDPSQIGRESVGCTRNFELFKVFMVLDLVEYRGPNKLLSLLGSKPNGLSPLFLGK